VLGMLGGGPSVLGVGDGSGSPTSKKELDQLERKNITTISR
jgi:pSer/pThr/pTyr-binding forkhead associated (FHA) protein